MAGKMNATTIIAIVLVVVGMTTMSILSTAEAARLDLSSIVGYIGINEESTITYKQQGDACCNICVCRTTETCHCEDLQPYICHAKCRDCGCDTSNPPICGCMDVDDFCYPPCSSSSSNDAAAAFINGVAN